MGSVSPHHIRSSRSRPAPDRRAAANRTRDYVRIFKACDTCKRKKTRCILDEPDEPLSACRKCKRERRPCSLTRAASPGGASKEHVSRRDSSVRPDQHQPGPTTWDNPNSAPETPSEFPASARIQSALMRRSPQRVQHGRIPDFRSMAVHTDTEGAENENVVIASISNAGDTLKVLQRPSGHQEEGGGDATDMMKSPGVYRSRAIGPLISALSDSSSELLRLWNSLRFVRMGWLTAREAVSYIDLFFKNLSPLSPILDDLYSHHENHYTLLTQEPLLCCTILMISARFHCLQGTSSWSRSVALHDRLWEHCQHLVTRIIFGQEKKSKAKTRTFGSIQALMLITEWAPRAVYFPPKSDGWDSDLLFQFPDERDQPGGNEADVIQDIHGSWFRDVVAPAKMIDRMSWMLLGCAVTLGHEIGLFGAMKSGANDSSGSSTQQEQQRRMASVRLRKVIFIADEQFSSRLGSSSLIPPSLSSSAFEPLPEESCLELEQKRKFVNGQLKLAEFARSMSKALFSSTTATRELIQSYEYVNTVQDFKQQLVAWRVSYLDEKVLSRQAYELLAIEYFYNVMFLNSLGMRAVVDRSSSSAPTRNSGVWIQNFGTTADLQFINEVIEAGCQIIQIAVRLADNGTLQYCPTRVTIRIIAASVFLLKALGLGVERRKFETTLNQLQYGIDALHRGTWDDLELAARYATVLDGHVKHYKESFVTQTLRQEASFTELVSDASLDDGIMNPDDINLADMQSFRNSQNWFSIPLDPFGPATDDDVGPAGPEDGNWGLLWNFPLFPE